MFASIFVPFSWRNFFLRESFIYLMPSLIPKIVVISPIAGKKNTIKLGISIIIKFLGLLGSHLMLSVSSIV